MPLQTKVKAEKVGNFQPALLGRIHPALTIVLQKLHSPAEGGAIRVVVSHFLPEQIKGTINAGCVARSLHILAQLFFYFLRLPFGGRARVAAKPTTFPLEIVVPFGVFVVPAFVLRPVD
ncbi:hypothetical protein [Pseudovibrio sp. Tun.PSC04-5.I4]|uniref:hypothetical protein n=1 Tax=Pseudovibrio sp. Tun.PSC04-5.I4 TaxID=1798213 RepID=UPI000B83F36D|nr:hypothetical protein [Pseudovibrio sp. Tun.PSC04-5.I4]